MEKLTFALSGDAGELDDIQRTIGCIEDVEKLFNIEFASGIEEGKPLFFSDVRWTDAEDAFLEKHDGNVVEHIFRLNGEDVIDTRINPCVFETSYDPDYHYTGSEKFSKPRISIRGRKKAKKIV